MKPYLLCLWLLRALTLAKSLKDLSPTLDAPQSAEIKALAAELGNNPYKIHQWVYDNIRFFPTYGSVQGAEETLAKKSGNAFDTASLLIALLRSAGIESRYVYGTVRMPAEQVMNWVGDAKTPEAAQQILGQGGIPNTGLVSGGRIAMIRMEHVWVEAWIKFYPERGIDHVGGTSEGDSWVPLDASFKQYTYTQGMDLQDAVPFNAEALITAAQQGAEVNEAEGWVRNVNQTAVESQFKAYQQQLKNYLEAQNNGQSTVGDVLGTTRIKINPLPYLAGTLPYEVQATASRFTEMPDNLRAKFRYRIYASQNDRYYGDSPILNFEAPTATLAGKKVTLTWVAADESQQKALEALIPTPQPGQQLSPNDLPKTIPASIRLKPQIRVDGELKAEGTAQNVGNEPIGAGAFTRYGTQQWDESADQLIVGQQTAIGLSIQGISQSQLDRLKTRMEETKATLEAAQKLPQEQQAGALQGLTGEHITGDLLTATIWGYYASLQSYGTTAASQAEMIDLPGLSYGVFHAQVKVNQLYGIVTTGVSFQGLNLDMGHMRHIRWVKDDNPASAINAKPELTQNGKTATQNRWIAYNRTRGQHMSAMEHAVPEQFWVDRNQCRYIDENGQIQNPALPDCGQAVSAVKAIAIAQSQGQKIYTITQENASTVLAKLPIGGSVGQEVRNAVNAGKEVTVHEKPINAFGWTGYGYSIIDPETGEGGYVIEGSGNGGVLDGFLDWVKNNPGYTSIATLILSIVASFTDGVAGTILAVVVVVLSVIALYYELIELWNDAVNLGGLCGAAFLTLFGLLTLFIFGIGFAAEGVGAIIALAVLATLASAWHQLMTYPGVIAACNPKPSPIP
ncbi:MAG: transglutaminase-like domain-containing protein [Zoogloeaceae bacterium]|nr:transglutaminase-like domain-containing protein [Zoogloeaceae bacterium]